MAKRKAIDRAIPTNTKSKPAAIYTVQTIRLLAEAQSASGSYSDDPPRYSAIKTDSESSLPSVLPGRAQTRSLTP